MRFFLKVILLTLSVLFLLGAGINADLVPIYGSWSPTVIGSATQGSPSGGSFTGIYAKLGKLVYVSMRGSWTSHTGTGNLKVNLLPFTPTTTANVTPACSFYTDGLTLTASSYLMGLLDGGGSTQVSLYSAAVGGPGVVAVAMDTSVSVFVMTCIYLTD